MKFKKYRHGDLGQFIGEFTGAFAKAGERAKKNVKSGIQEKLDIVKNEVAEYSDDLNNDVERPDIDVLESPPFQIDDILRIENLTVEDHAVDPDDIPIERLKIPSNVEVRFISLICIIIGVGQKNEVLIFIRNFLWPEVAKCS